MDPQLSSAMKYSRCSSSWKRSDNKTTTRVNPEWTKFQIFELALAKFHVEVNSHIDFLSDVRFSNSVAIAVHVDAKTATRNTYYCKSVNFEALKMLVLVAAALDHG